MLRTNRELWLALVAILAITIADGLVTNALQGIPAAGSLFGHGPNNLNTYTCVKCHPGGAPLGDAGGGD